MFLAHLYLLVVMNMKKIKPRKGVSLTVKVLRLLGGRIELSWPLRSQEEIVHTGISGNNYYNYRKEIETARLEAERKKAEALMEWQKRRFIC